MNDNATHVPASDSVHAQRDLWIARYNEAQQQIQELRYLLVIAIHGPLGADNIEKARVLLEKTK